MLTMALVLALAGASDDLNLTCSGGGVRRPSDAGAFNFGDQVSVEIRGNGGRIRVPAAMLPDVHSGSGDWRELSDVRVTEREITARFSFNMFNHPHVRIDRMSGHLWIEAGRGQFSGDCQAADPTVRRF